MGPIMRTLAQLPEKLNIANHRRFPTSSLVVSLMAPGKAFPKIKTKGPFSTK